jgi:peptide/nickel transport system substrate-binding protein
MQRTWFTPAGAAACAAAALALTACTSSSGGSDGAASAPKPVTDAAISSFNFAISDTPSTLSGWSTYIADEQISSLVTQPLMIAQPDGTPTPNLATAVAQPNPTTLVYTLRPGVKFSDGTPLTAADVAWSLNEAAAPTSPSASGMPSFAAATAQGDTVHVSLKFPDPTAEASISTVAVMEKKFGAAHLKAIGTPAALPVGTGPYEYAGETSQAVNLVPNPHYWGVRPKVEDLTFTIISEPTSAELAMRSGSLQGASVPDVAALPEWSQIDGASVYATPILDSNLLSFDTSAPPFNDVHVRRAVAYSVDLAGVLKAAFGKYYAPLAAAVPVGEVTGVTTQQAAQAFYATLPQYGFDLAAAKSQLAQSKYPHGFSVTVPYISTDPWMQLLLLNLQQNMKPLGVTINLKPETGNQWAQAIFSHQATGLQVLTGFTTTLPDPMSLLAHMVGKANETPGLINIANFSTPAVEAALPKITAPASASYANAQRWDATKIILSEIASQAAYVPLFSSDSVFVLAKGMTFTQAPTTFDQISGQWINSVRATG